MLNKLYKKTLKLASHKSSNYFLAFVSFIESSFFPIPPDVMIVPMVMAKKSSYIKIFLISTIFSTLGGLLGYLIGYTFIECAMIVIEFYGYENSVYELQNKLSSKGGLLLWLGTLFLAGFTPLPFKVFTITSGILGFNIFIFIIICLISRGLRFFLVAFFSMKLGPKFETSLEKNGSAWFTVIGLIIIIFFAIIYFIINK
jgi:membrane protein YqaA with SNARE-associated domain